MNSFWLEKAVFLSVTKLIFTYTETKIMTHKTLGLFLFCMAVLMIAPSCNHNKIACPTYADSIPQTKKSKKPEAPAALPKASKPRLSIMPPGH